MRLVIIATALSILVVAGPASAQMSSFFRNLGLTPEEMELAGGAAESLYTKPGIRSGQTASWKSKTSQASGSVEVVGVTDAGRCVAFVHRVRPIPDGREQPMELRRCKSDDGRWILAP